MTPTEYATWNVYFEEQAVHRQRAENRAKGVVDFTDPKASAQLIGMVRGGVAGASGRARPKVRE